MKLKIILALLFTALGLHSVSGQSWVQLISASNVLGSPLTYNPINPNTLYASAGASRLYISYNRGRSWANYGTAVQDGGIIKSIAVNQTDTLQILVGVESASSSIDRIMKSTDGAVTWTEVWGGSFSFYGRPVEYKPAHPDTVYTMGLDTLWRSTNFGATWDTVRRVTGFNTWCDAQIRPDSANIIFIGDNLSGIWKTTDHGSSWVKKYSTFGEIPSIAIDPFEPRVAYAGKYGGGGGLLKTTNGGETWSSLTVPSGSRDTWWVSCSREHPGHVYYGTYTGDTSAQGIFFSRDAGASWQRYKAGLSPSAVFNYGLMAIDSLSVLAVQSNGLYRLAYPTSIQITSPNGGEQFSTSSQQLITWTSAGLYYLKLEFSSNNGSSWSTLVDSIPSAQTSYLWTVPSQFSDSCRLRLSDRIFTTTADTTDSVFSISNAHLILDQPNGGEVLSAGSYYSLEWTHQNVGSISIEYSIDSGASWTYITKVPGTASSFLWLVPNTPSERCLFRLFDITDTSIADVSDSVFTIEAHTSFLAYLYVKDFGGTEDSLLFASAATATDSIDTLFGEVALGPKPGPGTYDLRWFLENGEETRIDYRDTVGSANEDNLYICTFQPGPSGYPCTLRWNPAALTSGSYLMRDTLTHGLIVLVDMRRESTYVVSDPSITALEILQCEGVEVTYPGVGDWRLLSLPMVQVDRRKTTLFPYSGSAAYAYHAGYKSVDSLAYGEGYWLKNEQTVLSGCPILSDSFVVQSAWNIIGSISLPVPVSAISSVPETIIVSSFFGYNSGYFIADTLFPGEGYWVKSSAPGQLALSATPGAQSKPNARIPSFEKLNSITIGDGKSWKQKLYFGSSDQVEEKFLEMPPVPPASGPSAAFGDRGIAHLHPKIVESAMELPISVILHSSQIYFSWGIENEKNFTYILIEKVNSQTVAEYQLPARGNLILPYTDRQKFSIVVGQSTQGSVEIPRGFSLGEFYPNPFNPVTRCTFAIPFDADVSVIVYSILGEEVVRLVDERRSAGVHEIEWTGTRKDRMNVSSGVYVVRVIARAERSDGSVSEFTSVKKLIYAR